LQPEPACMLYGFRAFYRMKAGREFSTKYHYLSIVVVRTVLYRECGGVAMNQNRLDRTIPYKGDAAVLFFILNGIITVFVY
jgi:hypothetical protein